MTTLPVTLRVGEGCKDILSHLYELGQDFHGLKHKYPLRTESCRRTLAPYLFRDFSRGEQRWTAWAYHTTRGVVVCARVATSQGYAALALQCRIAGVVRRLFHPLTADQ